MNHIPDAVYIRNLVREKLNKIKPAGDADDGPVVEHIKPAGQFHAAEFLKKPKDGNGGVQINAAGPGSPERKT